MFPLVTPTCSSLRLQASRQLEVVEHTTRATQTWLPMFKAPAFIRASGPARVQLLPQAPPLRWRPVGAPWPYCPDRRRWKKPVLRLIGVNGPLHPLRGEPQFSLLHIHVSVGALTLALLEDRALLPRPPDCPLLRVCWVRTGHSRFSELLAAFLTWAQSRWHLGKRSLPRRRDEGGQPGWRTDLRGGRFLQVG